MEDRPAGSVGGLDWSKALLGSAITGRLHRVPEVLQLRILEPDHVAIHQTLRGRAVHRSCHELDHLNGTLFPSRIPGMRGDLLKRRVRKMAKDGEWDEVVP